MVRRTRGAAAVALLACGLLAVGLSGCGAGGVPAGATVPSTSGPDYAALNAAVPALNAARQTVLADSARLAQAAGIVDGIATAAATGDPGKVTRQQDLAAELGKAHAVLQRLPAETGAYADSLQRLDSAGAPLAGARASAVHEVVAKGRAEVAAVQAFAAAAHAAFAVYDDFRDAESLWYQRASDGWYRSTHESAGAYAVLLDPVAARLGKVQAALADADSSRRLAVSATSFALQQAETVFSAPQPTTSP